MSQTEVQLIKADAVQTADIANSAVTDAKISALTSSKLTGALPAISGAALTNLPAGGKFASYAIIADQKATDTAGGSSTTGTFNTRDLNTELADPDGIVTISSNQFTLQAGTYRLHASSPAYKAARHQIIIWNATDSSITAVGTPEYCGGGESVSNRAFATGRTTITGAKAFEVRHRVGYAEATYGLGVEGNYDLQPNIYTYVEIFKES